MSEHELDKLFSKKLASRTFAYNPKAWEAMEEMLDERKRSYTAYWRSAAAILLMGCLLGIAALTQTTEVAATQQQESVVTNEASTSEETIVTQKPESNYNQSLFTPEAAVAEEAYVDEATDALQQNTRDIASENIESTPLALGTEEPLQEAPGEEVPVVEETTALAAATPHGSTTLQSLPSLKVQPIQAMPDFMGDLLARVSRKKPVHKHWGKAYANVSALMSSLDYSARQGAGFAIGLGYTTQLSKKWQAGAELNLTQRNTPNFAFKNDSVFYGFTQERVTHTTEVRSLTHLQLPLYVNYTVANKHRIGVGAYAAVLLYADVVSSKEKRSFEDLTQKSSIAVEGEKDWVNPLVVGGFVQYSYILSGDLELGVRAGSSFTDLDNENGNKRLLGETGLFLHYGF